MNGTEVTWNTEAHCSPGAAAHQTFIYLYYTMFTSFGTFGLQGSCLVYKRDNSAECWQPQGGEGRRKTLIIPLSGILDQTARQQTLLSLFHLCSRSLCVCIVKQRRQGQLFVLTDKTENEVG